MNNSQAEAADYVDPSLKLLPVPEAFEQMKKLLDAIPNGTTLLSADSWATFPLIVGKEILGVMPEIFINSPAELDLITAAAGSVITEVPSILIAVVATIRLRVERRLITCPFEAMMQSLQLISVVVEGRCRQRLRRAAPASDLWKRGIYSVTWKVKDAGLALNPACRARVMARIHEQPIDDLPEMADVVTVN